MMSLKCEINNTVITEKITFFIEINLLLYVCITRAIVFVQIIDKHFEKIYSKKTNTTPNQPQNLSVVLRLLFFGFIHLNRSVSRFFFYILFIDVLNDYSGDLF